LAALVVTVTVQLQSWLWSTRVLDGLPTNRPLLWCLIWTGGIGLLLSLLQRRCKGSELPELPETLSELRQPEGLKDRHGTRQLLGGVLALAGGGTLGPEALMTRLIAVGSHAIWRSADKNLVAAAMAGTLGLFQSPLVGGAALADRRWELIWRWLPGILGGMAGFVAFNGLSDLGGGLQGVPYVWPTTTEQRISSLIAALLAGTVGWMAGQMMKSWRRWLKQRQLHQRFWMMPVVTGLLIGLCLWGLPLAAFSGENQFQPLVLGAWQLSSSLLVVSALAKLLMVGLCLETGWRGGQFFPVVLASSALGIGLHEWIPWLGSLESWSAGVVGGSLSALLSSPLLALTLGLTLLEGHGAGSLMIGLLVGLMLKRES
jgi:H+/Cl- antiporter ClcA